MSLKQWWSGLAENEIRRRHRFPHSFPAMYAAVIHLEQIVRFCHTRRAAKENRIRPASSPPDLPIRP